MEAEIADVKRNAGNNQVLIEIESEIAVLENKFVEIEALENEKIRLETVVRNLVSEETATLAETTLSESAIVKKLGETRGRRDVQSSRLGSVQDRIENARADLATQGAIVRKAFASVIVQLLAVRQVKALAILQGLFNGPIRPRIGRVELKELVHQTVMVKEAKATWNKFALQIADPVQETAAWRRTREWLAETKNVVENEPGLTVKGLPRKQQPIEQPATEMATV